MKIFTKFLGLKNIKVDQACIQILMEPSQGRKKKPIKPRVMFPGNRKFKYICMKGYRDRARTREQKA